MKTERQIVSILRNVAREHDLNFESFSHDWIIRLSHGENVRWIFGYDFDINSCVAQILANDKAGSSLVLRNAGIPHVEHVLFNHPQFQNFVAEDGTWSPIHRYAARFDWDVVVKPNDGSGGNSVTRTSTRVDLEDAVQKLFSKVHAIAISPYLRIKNEYRTIVLDGRCLLVYQKIRPSIVGDGRSTRLELLISFLQTNADGVSSAKALAELGRQKVDLSQVVPEGDMWHINWKHNLALGSRANLISESSKDAQRQEIVSLALKSAAAINLRFGSVDVINSNDQLFVLEMNSGVMMESFVGQVPDGPAIAHHIYKAATIAAFSE